MDFEFIIDPFIKNPFCTCNITTSSSATSSKKRCRCVMGIYRKVYPKDFEDLKKTFFI